MSDRINYTDPRPSYLTLRCSIQNEVILSYIVLVSDIRSVHNVRKINYQIYCGDYQMGKTRNLR